MRNTFMQSFLLLALCGISSITYAQNITISPLRWLSTETTNLKNNERFSHTCAFVSTPTNIRWVQKNGAYVNDFSIVSVNGNWQNVAANGRIEYKVEKGKTKGLAVFERTAAGISVTLDFSQTGPNGIRHQFNIGQIVNEN
jgi:hypothetical protein